MAEAAYIKFEIEVPRPQITAADPDPLNEVANPSSAVQSFNARVGVVVSVAGDYLTSQVTNDSSVTGTYAKDALNWLLANMMLSNDVMDALYALDPVATDKLIYSTATNTFSTSTLTAFARTLLDDADAATARATLGVSATGADTTYNFRANNLSDVANAATARTNLGLGSIATQAANAIAITGGTISGLTALGADGLQLNTGVSPSHSEGLCFYDNVNKCLAYFNDEADSTMQVGQELWIRVKNNTGGPISNGQVCYLSGQDSGLPTVDLAQADAFATAVPTLGLATHSIEDGTIGHITAFGTVRDLNTSTYSPGDVIYLSDTVAGGFTTTRPSSPCFAILLGMVGVSHASTGSVEISTENEGNVEGVVNLLNGAILEDHTIAITSNGVDDVSLSIEKTGTGDLSLFFDGVFYIFDTSPAAEVSLDYGSDISPTLNYVFIPESTKTLTANTSGFPDAQHVPVATVLVQDVASVATDGCYKVHAWTDHVADSNNQGHISHLNHWIRHQHATWISGVAPTTSITVNAGAIDNVYFSNTAGVILQLHDHAFPALDMSDPEYVFVVNDYTTKYDRIADLSDTIVDSLNGSLRGNNTYYSLVVWGSVNEASGDCKLYVNAPSGSYSSATDAQDDTSGYSNYTIPPEFVGTGFLIARVILRYQTADSGTITEVETEDLRGSFPSSTAGGGGGAGGGSEFPDNLFRIQAVGDTSKEIDFDASGITAATTRTVTMPDADVTLPQTTLTTQYRMLYCNGANQINESSAITTDASGNLILTGSISVVGKIGAPNAYNSQTGTSYTAVADDSFKTVWMNNASANTFTIPTHASVPFVNGTIINVVWEGAGTTTVTGATGVTLNGVTSPTTGGAILNQFNAVTLVKRATDTWVAIGLGTVT